MIDEYGKLIGYIKRTSKDSEVVITYSKLYDTQDSEEFWDRYESRLEEIIFIDRIDRNIL
jgi:hypothetical protein